MSRPLNDSQLDELPHSVIPGEWTWFCNGRLRGCGLIWERQWVYAWDDSRSISLLDGYGDLIAQQKAPKELLDVKAAATGERLVAIGRSGDVWWLDRALEPVMEIRCPFDPLSVAIDAHGEYAVVTSHSGKNVVCTFTGKKVAEFDTERPLRFVQFVPFTGLIIASAENGLVACFDHQGRRQWNAAFWSNVGSMAVDGDGETILLACYGHGLARFNGDGQKEGTYRFEYSPNCVAVDFEGSKLIVSSLEEYLTELSFDGVVKGSRKLAQKPISLSLDPLGRYGLAGYESGQVHFFALPAFLDANQELVSTGSSDPSLAESEDDEPLWQSRQANNAQEAASVVMDYVPATEHLALFSRNQKLRIIDPKGNEIYESPGVTGIGRFLRHAKTWMTAATDQSIIAYDPADNDSVECTMHLHELSQLQLFDTYGHALVVESREFVANVFFPENIVWRKRMEAMVETAAVLPSGEIALALDNRLLLIFDQTGERIGKFRTKPAMQFEVYSLGDTWMTVTRESRMVRGHERDGSPIWAQDLPWDPWSVRKLADYLLINNAEGHSIIFNSDGEPIATSHDARQNARFFLNRSGQVCRIFSAGGTLFVATFEGRVLWRHEAEYPIGPFHAGPEGVWVFLGRQLSFFPLKL